MTMADIRRFFGVPARYGARIEYLAFEPPRKGTVVGRTGSRLLIKLDGQRMVRDYHPTFLIKYLEPSK